MKEIPGTVELAGEAVFVTNEGVKDISLDRGRGVREKAGFEAFDAAGAPHASGQHVHEDALVMGGGLEIGSEGITETLPLGGVFGGGAGGEDQGAGKESVAGVVAGGAAFSGRGAGAGGFLGVAAVGVELNLTHDFVHGVLSRQHGNEAMRQQGKSPCAEAGADRPRLYFLPKQHEWRAGRTGNCQSGENGASNGDAPYHS